MHPYPARLVLDRPAHADLAASHLVRGDVVAHGFANIYALTARAAAVEQLNALKGRPRSQTGSLTAPTGRVLDAFDLAALPPDVPPSLAADVVEAFSALGPFGFRGPAAAHVPPGLTASDAGTTTTQVIVPGDACPSQRFLAAAADGVPGGLLVVSSANRSRHVTGAADAPAHWRADALRAELGDADGLVVMDHADEAAARARFPHHTPASTSILALHRAGRVHGRVHLVLERHGSLAAADVAQVLAGLGVGLTIGPRAAVRLVPRAYPRLTRVPGGASARRHPVAAGR